MANFSQAYCGADEIQAITQVDAYSTTTKPTLADVTLYAQGRSAEVYAWVREIMGSAAPGPTDFDFEIADVIGTDAGKALNNAVRDASSWMAATDALQHQGIGDEPNESDRVERMRERFERSTPDVPSPLEASVKAAARSLLGRAGRSETHLSTGEQTQADLGPADEEAGFTFDLDTEF